MTLKSNSATPAYAAKAEPDTAIYKARVADVTMQTGYIDVYRAWRKGISPEVVKSAAERSGGFFDLGGLAAPPAKRILRR